MLACPWTLIITFFYEFIIIKASTHNSFLILHFNTVISLHRNQQMTSATCKIKSSQISQSDLQNHIQSALVSLLPTSYQSLCSSQLSSSSSIIPPEPSKFCTDHKGSDLLGYTSPSRTHGAPLGFSIRKSGPPYSFLSQYRMLWHDASTLEWQSKPNWYDSGTQRQQETPNIRNKEQKKSRWEEVNHEMLFEKIWTWQRNWAWLGKQTIDILSRFHGHMSWILRQYVFSSFSF